MPVELNDARLLVLVLIFSDDISNISSSKFNSLISISPRSISTILLLLDWFSGVSFDEYVGGGGSMD